jgi:hypothetical protein
MEFFLNSAWAMMAALVVCLWLRLESRGSGDRRLPFVALVMLIVILFPVISVSDDLWSIQNPAESDTCLRRGHLASSPHSIFPATAAPPQPTFAMLRSGYQRLSTPQDPDLPRLENPALVPIQNRPPPMA